MEIEVSRIIDEQLETIESSMASWKKKEGCLEYGDVERALKKAHMSTSQARSGADLRAQLHLLLQGATHYGRARGLAGLP